MRYGLQACLILALGTVSVGCDSSSTGDGGVDGDQPGECGDGTVNLGEDCDDGNTVAFDGCQPNSCTFTCYDASECNDQNECNGEGQCDPSSHVCVMGAPLSDGTSCTMQSGAVGMCASASCVPLGCGNNVLEAGEACDDGRDGDDADGCKDDCTFSCTADMDCADGDPCDGEETCDVAGTHACVGGTPPPETRWFIDCDGDGFAASELDSIVICPMPASAPSGCTTASATWTSVRPNSPETIDCHDSNANVFPGQTAYFETTTTNDISPPPGGTTSRDYDFNCDSTETRLYTTTFVSTTTTCPSPDFFGRCGRDLCIIGQPCPTYTGWTGSAPSCTPGASGQYTDCNGTGCSRRTYTKYQQCH